jgi:hypothetical protein
MYGEPYCCAEFWRILAMRSVGMTSAGSQPTLLLDALDLGRRHAPAPAHLYAVYAALSQLSTDRCWMGTEVPGEFAAEHEVARRQL